MEELAQTQTLYLASLIGGIAFALSGFLAGMRKNLDWMGLFILSFLTANGGGILRDLLTDQTPLLLRSNEPFLVTLAVMVAGSLLKLRSDHPLESRWLFIICDAVGLVAFAITGSLVAISVQAPFFGCITLALLTATGGGILRDILVNNVSEVLHSGFYGSVAILTATAIYGLKQASLLSPYTVLAIATASLLLRLVAYKYQWNLPRPSTHG